MAYSISNITNDETWIVNALSSETEDQSGNQQSEQHQLLELRQQDLKESQLQQLSRSRNGKNAKNVRNPELVALDMSTSPNIVTTYEIHIPLPPTPERGQTFELREAERAVKRN